MGKINYCLIIISVFFMACRPNISSSGTINLSEAIKLKEEENGGKWKGGGIYFNENGEGNPNALEILNRDTTLNIIYCYSGGEFFLKVKIGSATKLILVEVDRYYDLK
jgi:hypothetical protein